MTSRPLLVCVQPHDTHLCNNRFLYLRSVVYTYVGGRDGALREDAGPRREDAGMVCYVHLQRLNRTAVRCGGGFDKIQIHCNITIGTRTGRPATVQQQHSCVETTTSFQHNAPAAEPSSACIRFRLPTYLLSALLMCACTSPATYDVSALSSVDVRMIRKRKPWHLILPAFFSLFFFFDSRRSWTSSSTTRRWCTRPCWRIPTRSG